MKIEQQAYLFGQEEQNTPSHRITVREGREKVKCERRRTRYKPLRVQRK
jgi:hypothetical protein